MDTYSKTAMFVAIKGDGLVDYGGEPLFFSSRPTPCCAFPLALGLFLFYLYYLIV